MNIQLGDLRIKPSFSLGELKFANVDVTSGGYDRGYAAGYETGQADGYNKGHTEGHDAGYYEGYDKGLADGASEAAKVEDKINENGILDTTYPSVGTLSEKIDRLLAMSDTFNALTSFSFSGNSGISEIPFYINKRLTNAAYLFYNTTNLVRIVGIDTSRVTNGSHMFNGSGIQVIEQAFDFSACTSLSAFYNAQKLVEVRIVAGTIKVGTTISSPYLSDVSIQSIVYGLADLTGKTRQKLIVHSAVYKRIPDDLFLYADARNWDVE